MTTRRSFLKLGAWGLSLAAFGGLEVKAGSDQATKNTGGGNLNDHTLVIVFLRGGMDGLMAVTPYRDDYLKQARPNISLSPKRRGSEKGLIDLDDRFGLHPGLAALYPHYRKGELAVLHGVGLPIATRSHFDGQDFMESGTPNIKSTRSGWMNRTMASMNNHGIPAMAFTETVPRSLFGDHAVLAMTHPRDLGLGERRGDRVHARMRALYTKADEDLMRGTAGDSLAAIEILKQARLPEYRPRDGVTYPAGSFAERLKYLAAVIKAGVGLRLAFVDLNGWDNHSMQHAAQAGFNQPAKTLAGGLTAFRKDLRDTGGRVLVMVMTEFGRTVAENGSRGTDHGRGSCFFLLGRGVRGGKVHGEVPQIKPKYLEDGRDLPVTTDYRAVVSEVVGKHLGITDQREILPGWSGAATNLLV